MILEDRSHILIDAIALIWFLLLWFGYGKLADSGVFKGTTLVKAMHRYRLQWVKQMIHRSERLVDVRIVGNLLQTSTFLASTSVLIIGGLFAVLGYGDRALPILQRLPYVQDTPDYMWTVKTIFLIFIFVYSFFKLTWIIRQYNFVSVIMLAAPVNRPGEDSLEDLKKQTKYISKISALLTNSARHFNNVVRSYYFACVALSWYISPFLMIALSIIVVMVLYRREFKSRTFDKIV